MGQSTECEISKEHFPQDVLLFEESSTAAVDMLAAFEPNIVI